MPPIPSDLTVTDQFCGAGGSTEGALRAGARVRMALNHWDRACATYAENHHDTWIDRTDISACDPRRYPSTDLLITSPECTNHSLAKGVKQETAQGDFFTPTAIDPAAERSRATMWDVWRFAEHHRYRAIIVENVVDARKWILWDAWWQAGEALGYRGRCVYLNSMHVHPTPQSRDRMYVVWWKRGNRAPDLDIRPRAFCGRCAADVASVQVWKRPDRPWGKYRTQYVYACPACATLVEPYYFCALNALDLSLPAVRIGDRKRPLTPTTMRRLAYGLEKYGRTTLEVMVSQPGTSAGRSHEAAGRVRAVAAEPALTQTGSAHLAVATPWLVDLARSNDADPRVRAADAPAPTQTTRHTQGVAMPPLLVNTRQHGREASRARPATAAAATQTGCADGGVAFAPDGVVAGAKVMTLRDPVGGFLHSDVTAPVFTQLGREQAALVSRDKFLVSYYGALAASHPLGPVPTQTALARHALVDGAAAAPALADLRVEDLYFRMLATHEIRATMAFPDAYIITGDKREQVKQLGNAVTPPSMKELVVRVLASLAPEIADMGLAAIV